MLGTSLLWRSTVAFTYLKVKSDKCLRLLPVVLVLEALRNALYKFKTYLLKNLLLFTSLLDVVFPSCSLLCNDPCWSQSSSSRRRSFHHHRSLPCGCGSSWHPLRCRPSSIHVLSTAIFSTSCLHFSTSSWLALFFNRSSSDITYDQLSLDHSSQTLSPEYMVHFNQRVQKPDFRLLRKRWQIPNVSQQEMSHTKRKN